MASRIPIDVLIAHAADAVHGNDRCATLRLDGTPAEQWPAAAATFLHDTLRHEDEPIALVFGGEQSAAEQQTVQAALDYRVRARQNRLTADTFATQWGRNFCRTLKAAPPWATSSRPNWGGGPAFIVGAGPSLDVNGHLLRQCQERGPVIAVNTAAHACLEHGCTPDAIMCCEAVDVSDHLDMPDGIPTIISADAHPENWAAAPGAYAFSRNDSCYLPYVVGCRTVPLAYTASVSCAAISFAILQGCSPIVLLGQDCAYTGSRYYAGSTPFADLAVQLEGGQAIVTGSSKQQAPVSTFEVRAWGGGSVHTDYALAKIADWISATAEHHFVINATEGGAHIQNCYEQPAEKVLRDYPWRPFGALPEPPPCDTRELCADSCRKVERWLRSREVMPPRDVPLLNLWAMPAVMKRTAGEHDLARARRIRAACEQGAREMLEALA